MLFEITFIVKILIKFFFFKKFNENDNIFLKNNHCCLIKMKVKNFKNFKKNEKLRNFLLRKNIAQISFCLWK
jgi:hypothetical protein